VRLSSQPQQLERRDNVRVRASVRLELRERVVSLSDFRFHNERGPIQTSTVDLSGGGFSIRHPTYLAIGLPFEATLSLPDKKGPLAIASKVVRCDRVPESVGEEYEIGFAYERISESVRSRIVRFVFSAQLSEIQRDPEEGETAKLDTRQPRPPESG
jgi:c-di-GMP-binding flagellar brake protein YcgR